MKLFDILKTRRPSGSMSEAKFAARLVAYASTLATLDFIDEAGNISFVTSPSETIFAAHLDTVCSGDADVPNTLITSGNLVTAENHQLGADDGAGIYLLLELMRNKVPGRFIFTRGEEVSGTGASYLADNFDFTPYKRSICFDRAGTSEIITVQSGERLASSEFAEALSVAFQEQDLLYVESENGVFTDNALWGDKVAESVNLSAGYFAQHGPNEFLDLTHLEALAAAVIKIDWEALPTCREPGIVEDLVFAAIDEEWQEACVKASRGDFKFFQEQGFRTKDLRLVDEWPSLSLANAWEIEQYLEETLTEET